jgi:hypothetical protein
LDGAIGPIESLFGLALLEEEMSGKGWRFESPSRFAFVGAEAWHAE